MNALKGFLDPFAKWITMKDQVCSCTVGDNLSPQVLGVHKPEELRKLLLFLGQEIGTSHPNNLITNHSKIECSKMADELIVSHSELS